MSDEKKPFSDKRWTEIPTYSVVGHVELSKEEQEATRKKLLELMERFKPEEKKTKETQVQF